MSYFLPLPDWLPWWVPIAVLVPALLYLLVFLLMPFSVFGLKGRLDAIEARLDEIQDEIRTLVLRMPESRGLEWTDAPPPIPPLPRSVPERSARPPIPRRRWKRRGGQRWSRATGRRRAPSSRTAPRRPLPPSPSRPGRPCPRREARLPRPAADRCSARPARRAANRSRSSAASRAWTGHAEAALLAVATALQPRGDPAMRVSVVQMNAGHDEGRQHRPGPRPDRTARSPRTGRTSSACRKCGPASAATARRSSARPRSCRRPAATSPAARPTSSCAASPAS